MPKFFDRYINLADATTDLLYQLKKRQTDFEELERQLIPLADYSYETGKWNTKEVLQHIIDNERIQSYRALAISRSDKSIFPGYNEEQYIANCESENLDILDLLSELRALRQTTFHLFQKMNSFTIHQSGNVFDVNITALGIGFHIIGHEIHHFKTLQEKYLK